MKTECDTHATVSYFISEWSMRYFYCNAIVFWARPESNDKSKASAPLCCSMPMICPWWWVAWFDHIDGLVQDSRNSIVNTLELLQSCTKPSLYLFVCRSTWHLCQHLKIQIRNFECRNIYYLRRTKYKLQNDINIDGEISEQHLKYMTYDRHWMLVT